MGFYVFPMGAAKREAEIKRAFDPMKFFLQLFLLLSLAVRISAAQQTVNTGTNPNDGTGDSLRGAFAKVNANFTEVYGILATNVGTLPFSSITATPVTLSGYGITNGVSYVYAAANYAPISSPTFTGTVTIPGGASISGYLTTATAASTYAPLASPSLTGTPLSTTAAVDTSTTQIATTAFVVGQAASATPLIDGTAAAGSSTRYARGDHIHPTDTSRAPLASPTFTGTPAGPTAAVDTSTTQLATTAYVVGQGYLKSATAASTYAPLTGAGTSGTWGISISGNSATATNLTGGAAGSLPYQTASGTTTTLAIGAANTVLTSSGTSPQWSSALSGLSSIGITGGSVSSSTPLVNGTQTWTGGGTFTGNILNITDTSSSASSLFADWQVGGVSKLSVVKTGKILGNGANPYLYLDNAAGSQLGYGTGILNNGGSSLTWSSGGTEVQRVDGAGLISVASGGGLQWSSTSASSGSKDLILQRDAAGILALRNGTTAESLRVYNTFTDASNYERAVFDWSTSANVLTIGTQAAGTGSGRRLSLVSASDIQITSPTSSIQFTAGGRIWEFGSSAQTPLYPNVDNAYNLGVSTSANRVANGFFGTGVFATGAGSKLEIWNTDGASSTTVVEKGVFDWTTTANTLTIGAKAIGGATQRSVAFDAASYNFGIAGTTAATLTSTQLNSQTDGGVSLGTSTANRFNNIYGKAQIAATGAASSIEVWNTDASVGGTAWDKGVFDFTTTANTLTIGTQKGATGLNRVINYIAGGNLICQMSTGGFYIQSGGLTLTKTINGTTGSTTISKTTGQVIIAAGSAADLTVTSTLCATTSIIIATVAGKDTTLKSVAVVAGSGSFTITPNAAPTADCKVNFILTN